MMEPIYQTKMQTDYDLVSLEHEEERETWIRDTYSPTSD